MTHYLIEFGDNTLHKTFRTDEDAISFCKYLTLEYEVGGHMYIMKEMPYEDHLASGFYWSLVWNNIDF